MSKNINVTFTEVDNLHVWESTLGASITEICRNAPNYGQVTVDTDEAQHTINDCCCQSMANVQLCLP